MIFLIFCLFTIIVFHTLIFLFGYYSSIQEMKKSITNKRKNDELWGEKPHSWRLNPEDIDKIDDWEVYSEKVDRKTND